MSHLILGPVVGGVTQSSALIWARADATGVLYAWVGSQPDLSDATLAGASLQLRAEDGFAGVAPIQNLSPNHRYYYAIHLGTGSQPPPDKVPADNLQGSFTTSPVVGVNQPFNFVFGSCFRPAKPDSGMIYQRIASLRLVEDLRFILLLGDQVYADDFQTNGLGRIALTLQDYRDVYQHDWANASFRTLLKDLPAFMTLDDHEVDDDWCWSDPERQIAHIPWWNRIERWLRGYPRSAWQISRQRVRDALQAYWEHQGMHAPHQEQSMAMTSTGQYQLEESDPGSLAYTFEFGGAAFFVMDTRTMRVRGSGERTMLGSGQWQLLESWLLSVKDRYPVKFLVSSGSVLFRMWADIPKDRWTGYTVERDRLLQFIAANDIQGVYILTGDLHSGHAIQAKLFGPGSQDLVVWEFCASPFEQKPNRLAKLTHANISSPALKDQYCHWIFPQANFGVVRVGFTSQGDAQVTFELRDEFGQLLGSAGESEQSM